MMTFSRINGATLHYRYLPRPGRPAIVFVNSLGTDLRIWNEVEHLLADDFALLFHDKRGHGLSELGQSPHRIETLAHDLAGLLDLLGIDRFVVCGLSVGGLVAQSLYAMRPDGIDGLILCGTAARIGTNAAWNSRIEATRTEGIESFADGVLEKWFTRAFHRERAVDLAGCRTMLVRQAPAGYAATCEAIRDADYRAGTAAIRVPALCIVGDQDGSTPPELVASLARSIPGARYEVIAQAGHIPCIEQPERLVDLIRDFMDRDVAPRRG